MGVIWLQRRDGSTSHKILPEFPDLCVLLLLLIFVTQPIYLLHKYPIKGNPANLKSNESLLNPFLFRKQFSEVKSIFIFVFSLCMVNLWFHSEKFHVSSYI